MIISLSLSLPLSLSLSLCPSFSLSPDLHWGSLTCLPLHTQTLIRTINIDRRKVAITSTFLRGYLYFIIIIIIIIIIIMYLLSAGTNGCLNRGILMMDRINPSSENNIGTVMKIMTGTMREGRREGKEGYCKLVLSFLILYSSLSLSLCHTLL